MRGCIGRQAGNEESGKPRPGWRVNVEAESETKGLAQCDGESEAWTDGEARGRHAQVMYKAGVVPQAACCARSNCPPGGRTLAGPLGVA